MSDRQALQSDGLETPSRQSLIFSLTSSDCAAMSAENPLVTIALPVYNGQSYLRQAIRSVLRQTFRDFELLLLDNASTDGTPQICREAVEQDRRVRYATADENRGLAWNHNRAIELARGRYLMWMSHDDALGEDCVRRCVEALNQDPGVVLSFTNASYIDANGELIKQVKGPNACYKNSPSGRFRSVLGKEPGCEAFYGLMRTETLKKTGLLGYFAGSDLILLCEMALHGRFTLIPDFLFLRRHHPLATGFRCRTTREITLIFDPRKAGKLFLPYLLTVKGFLAAIGRARLPWKERLRCYRSISIWLWKQKREFYDDFLVLVAAALKRCLSQANIDRLKSLRRRVFRPSS